MAGLLSAAGFRRTALAVTLTGTVCAGVAWFVYTGAKKHQALGKSTALGDGAGVQEKKPVTGGKEPLQSKNEGHTEATDKAVQKPSVEVTVAEPSPTPDKPESASPISTETGAKKSKSGENNVEQDKAVAKGFVAKVETIVSSAAPDLVKAEVTAPVAVVAASPVKAPPTGPSLACGDGPTSLSSLDSRFDSDIIIIEDVDKVAEAVRDDDDVIAAAKLASQAAKGSGDVAVSPGTPLSGKQQREEDAEVSAPLCSLGDDIEVLHDSPASTDTADSLVSGDFVKCAALDVERGAPHDLSQSIEIIKAPTEEDENKNEDADEDEDEDEAEVENGNEAEVETGSGGDGNANFQSPRSTAGVPSVTAAREPEMNANLPEEAK